MPSILPPAPVLEALEMLHRAGCEAWAVGGCVRDSLLGRTPHDWDITTSALPQRTMEVFAGHTLLPTGLQHGTLTLRSGGMSIEITTYRVDGPYSDGRRPDSISFTASLTQDLARRDFTVNAMAWNPRQGLQDPFDGRGDLDRRLVRCVGDPNRRFGEDGLRVARALRFASVLGFGIEAETAAALHRCAPMLDSVAPERILPELTGLCCGPDALPVLLEYGDVLARMVPCLAPMPGHPQHNVHHIYDVWEHTVRAMAHAEPLPHLRLALLFHDCGKPACFTLDEAGTGHFYGHGKESLRLAAQALQAMACPAPLRRSVLQLVEYHDAFLPLERPKLRRWLALLGPRGLLDLVAVKRADNAAQNPLFCRSGQYDREEALIRAVIEAGDCFSLAQLAVKGSDLVALGLQGPQVGLVLDRLLTDVMDDRLPNQREVLLNSAKRRAEKLLAPSPNPFPKE